MKSRFFLLILVSLSAPLSVAHAALTAESKALPNGPQLPLTDCALAVPNDPCGLGCIGGNCWPQPVNLGPGAPYTTPLPKIGGSQVDFFFTELTNAGNDDDFCFELADGPGINTSLKLRCRLAEAHHPFNPGGTGDVRIRVNGLENDGTTYCWRMKNQSTSGWAANPKCFRNGPPAPPNLGDPEDTYDGHGQNVTFRWQSGSPDGVVTRWEIDIEPNVGNCDNAQAGLNHVCGPFPNIGETYAWSVKACDSDDDCRESESRLFVNGEVPDRPTAPSIQDDTISTVFSWNKGPAPGENAGNPTKYHFWLTPEGGASNTAHGCPKSLEEAISEEAMLPPGTTAGGISCSFTQGGGTYRWHIRACNLRGCGPEETGTYTQSADEVLAPINLSEIDHGEYVSFGWQANPNGLPPTDYEFWVLPAQGHDCETGPGPNARTGGPGANCNFDSGGGYTWYVSACDDGCSQPASRPFTKSAVLPENPQGLGTNGACRDVVFQWSAGAGPPPTDYQFFLTSLDGGFVPIECVSAQVPGTSFGCDGLGSGFTYQWTVQACRPDGCREPGVTDTFTVNAPQPGVPSLVWPAHVFDETTGTRPDQDFEWTPTLHAAQYRLEVDSGNPANSCDETISGTSFGACPSLPADGTWFFVRVTAISSCGEQAQGAVHVLRSLPEVVAPSALGVVDAGREMTFEWNSATVEGPPSLDLFYQLEVRRRRRASDPFAPLSGSPFTLSIPAGVSPSITLGEGDGIEYERWDYEYRVVALVEGGNPESPVELGEAQAATPWLSHEAGPRTQAGAPRPLQPGRGRTELGTSVVLEWDVGTDAEFHEVYVWDPSGPVLPNCNGRFSDAIGLDGVQTTLCSGLPNDGRLYYWRVVACNDYDADGDEECTDSPTWFFLSGVANEPGQICPMP